MTESNSRISRTSIRYQPDIKAFCTPDIMRGRSHRFFVYMLFLHYYF